ARCSNASARPTPTTPPRRRPARRTAADMQALPEGAVAGVVVTRNRRDLLAESLKVIESQSRPVDHLIVVDNGPDEESARDVVEAYSRPVTYLPSYRNL